MIEYFIHIWCGYDEIPWQKNTIFYDKALKEWMHWSFRMDALILQNEILKHNRNEVILLVHSLKSEIKTMLGLHDNKQSRSKRIVSRMSNSQYNVSTILKNSFSLFFPHCPLSSTNCSSTHCRWIIDNTGECHQGYRIFNNEECGIQRCTTVNQY